MNTAYTWDGVALAAEHQLLKAVTATVLLMLCCAERMLVQLSNDPYKEWWSLQFDPAAESRAHDHLSSLTYMPVMLQVSNRVVDQSAQQFAGMVPAMTGQICQDLSAGDASNNSW